MFTGAFSRVYLYQDLQKTRVVSIINNYLQSIAILELSIACHWTI
jgi:hypothetical protein